MKLKYGKSTWTVVVVAFLTLFVTLPVFSELRDTVINWEEGNDIFYGELTKEEIEKMCKFTAHKPPYWALIELGPKIGSYLKFSYPVQEPILFEEALIFTFQKIKSNIPPGVKVQIWYDTEIYFKTDDKIALFHPNILHLYYYKPIKTVFFRVKLKYNSLN